MREKQKTLKISIIKEIPLHCVFPEQHDSRRKWKWGSCASMGHFCQITQAQAGDLCYLNIPSRTTVQQQHMSVMSTGFKTPQTVPQLLGTQELHDVGTTVMLVWRVPACSLPNNPNLDACLLPQATVHHGFSCIICWLPCSMGFLLGQFPSVSWISCPMAVLCLCANIAREVDFSQDN